MVAINKHFNPNFAADFGAAIKEHLEESGKKFSYDVVIKDEPSEGPRSLDSVMLDVEIKHMLWNMHGRDEVKSMFGEFKPIFVNAFTPSVGADGTTMKFCKEATDCGHTKFENEEACEQWFAENNKLDTFEDVPMRGLDYLEIDYEEPGTLTASGPPAPAVGPNGAVNVVDPSQTQED